MPCVEWFNEQDASYQEEVLPAAMRARVSVEAGITPPWKTSSATPGESVGVDHYGASAAEAVLYKEFGITAEAVAAAAKASIAKARGLSPARAPAAIPKLQTRRNAVHMTDVLEELTQAGVSIWLDDISRERLRTGNLAGPDQGLPRARGDVEPDHLRQRARPRATRTTTRSRTWRSAGSPSRRPSRMITTYDIRWAADVLRPVYDASDGVDGRVSHRGRPAAGPRDRHDDRRGQAAVVAGRPAEHVHQDPGDRPRASPRSPRRWPRASRVNVTLIFSLQRYGEVIDAYMAGLEQAAANGHDISHDRVGGVVLRVPGGHRGRQAAERDRHAGGARAQGQGGHRQRAARLRAVRAEAGHRPVARARGQGRQGAAAAVGVHLHQGPVLPRHPVRGRPGRRRTR